jgi:general secretion pathway protein G
LVAAGYLKQIPKDPMTGAADWMVERGEDTVGSPDQQVGGISHVHSAASATSCEGPRYSSW